MESIIKTLDEFEANATPEVVGAFLKKIANDRDRKKHKPYFLTKFNNHQMWLIITRGQISSYSTHKVFTLQGMLVDNYEDNEGPRGSAPYVGEAIRFELWPKSSDRTWVIVQCAKHESEKEDLSKVNNEYVRYAGILKDELASKAFKPDKKEDSGHFAYSRQDRKDIVDHYRIERKKIKNKNSWAQFSYQISGRTLLNYEKEFPESET